MKRPLSMNERMEIGGLRFLNLFSIMYISGERYKEDKMGDNADPWPTPTLTSNGGEERSFHRYFVLLWIK